MPSRQFSPKVALLLAMILIVSLALLAGPGSQAQGTIAPLPTPSILIAAYLPLISKSASDVTPVATSTATSTPKPTPSGGDTDPPHMVTWSFAPASVDTSSADQVITFTAFITDDLSGIGNGIVEGRFRSPSKGQFVDVTFNYPQDLLWGTAQYGIYGSRVKLLQFCETGNWQLEFLHMRDRVGNFVSLERDDVAALSLPVSFQVTN